VIVRTLATIQHTSADYLGLVEDHLEGRRIRFRYYRPFTGGRSLPGPDDMAGGLVLLGGGPWGSAGGRDVPTLGAEVELARHALATGSPVLGIGLGAQILCRAAGGGSAAAPLLFDVGEGRRTRDDALNGFLPERFPLVRYLRDRPVLPDGAQVLAVDEQGEPCIFRIGTRALGFTGHPGMKTAMVEDLIMEFEDGPADPAPGLVALRERRQAIEDALVPIMTGVVQVLGLMEP
jgi:GMP synthase-like glutamine amidotransferase